MSARDGINVSPQQLQERQSMREIECALAPWMIQWAQQGQDYGRDGFVQIIDEAANGASVSPLTFLIQAKSHQGTLSSVASIPIETRHIRCWSTGPSSVLVALWSASDRQIAFRTARQIAAELDSLKPGWEDRASVGVQFRPEHVVTGKLARQRIRCWIADEADSVGGFKRLHEVRRRVLLTDLYLGTCSTAQTITTAAPGKKDLMIVLGPGWEDRELDAADVFAPRVLSGALLLFEEVLVPMAFLATALRALGPELLLSLLNAGHLVPVNSECLVGFVHVEDGLRGSPDAFRPQEGGIGLRRVAEALASTGKKPELRDAIQRTARLLPQRALDRVVRETNADLEKSAIRGLLGLSQHALDDHSEPIWDADLVNRLLHVNTAWAAAEEFGVDVVEYEAGLSRLASEKWYTELRFNRLFSSAESFDAVLRAAGVPDLGLLESCIGLPRIASLAVGEQAQEFRDWFWSWVYGLTEGGANVEAAVISRVERVVGQDLRALRLPSELKLCFFDQLGQDYIVGSGAFSGRHGYAGRSQRGVDALRRQAAIQAKRRREAIARRFGVPSPYGPCPCGSGDKFRFCCGARR